MTTVAIVGGGFSGAAVAYHLARAEAPADIVVFEPRGALGAGMAYGGRDPAHRINVPASRMSLLPDDDGHFTRWLEASGALSSDPEAWSGGQAYPRRREFGRYVDEAIWAFVASGRVRHVRDAVVSVCPGEGGDWRLVTAAGEESRADLVVIATTHPEPGLPPELRGVRENSRLIANGLADGALEAVGRDERLLIVGTGLTAADIVASLDARGHAGEIVMTSRRGLRPRGHPRQAFPPEGDFTSRPARKATELLARVRHAVREAVEAGRTWHPVLDAVRAKGGEIWAGLPPDARRRVVRHLRPYWDVHRFRAAPQIDAVLDRRLAAGSLEIRKARFGAVEAKANGFVVELKDTRRQSIARETFDRIVLATGPAHGDILRTRGFLRELSDLGLVTLDAAGLGLKTSLDGQAVGSSGHASPTLFIAGPLARGTFGELMGLPQVSRYAAFVAEQVGKALAERGSPALAAPGGGKLRELPGGAKM